MCSIFQGIQGAVVVSGGLVLSSLAAGAQADMSGVAAVTSDYVWRGSSQSRQNPAVQAGFKYAHASGLYAAAWGSSVKFVPDNGARSEFDLSAGWSGRLAPDWAFDAYFLRYQYPSSHADLNWNELNASLTWNDHYWVSVGHSNNAMASKSKGTYFVLGARYPVNQTWRVEGSAALYRLDQAFADSYVHAGISLVWAWQAPFELRLTQHATDSSARRLFPGMAGPRTELALQATF